MRHAFGYLLDENINMMLADYLRLHHPDLAFEVVGFGAAPPKATPDPDVLDWCESRGSVLVTDNRKSMPGHLADHLAAGRHVEGIFQVGSLTVVELGKHLVEVAEGSFADEYRDQIWYLPIA